MKVHQYIAYGLRIEADREIPGLRSASGVGRSDVELSFTRVPDWHQRPIDPDRVLRREPTARELPADLQVAWVRGGDGVRFDLTDGNQFFLSSDGTRIWARSRDARSAADALGYVGGPILGYVLRLRGVLALHASGVSLGGRAVAFVGPSGAGKSTFAATFDAAGDAVIADDVFAFREDASGFAAWPALDHVRVDEASVAALHPDSTARLELIGPTWDKHVLPLRTVAPDPTRPIPVAAIFRVTPHDRDEAAIATRADPQEALLTLLPHTSSAALLDGDLRRSDFEALSRLVHRVPVYFLELQHGFSHLAQAAQVVRRTVGG